MELRAVEHAVTHLPSPARSIACVAQPSWPRSPASPLFSVPALRSLHTGGYVHRSEFGSDDRHGTGHACFVTVTHPLRLAEGCYQSKARKRTRSPGWPRRRARSRSMHRASAPTRRPSSRTSRCLSRSHGCTCTARVREHERAAASRPIPGL
jgi:hypothetical protein